MAGGCWTLSTGPAATVRATIARLRKQQQGKSAGTWEKFLAVEASDYSNSYIYMRVSINGDIPKWIVYNSKIQQLWV